MKKKLIAIGMAALLAIGIFAGCAAEEPEVSVEPSVEASQSAEPEPSAEESTGIVLDASSEIIIDIPEDQQGAQQSADSE